MTFADQATQASSTRATDPASWETPGLTRAERSLRRPELLKGSLTVAGTIAFLRDNGRRILLIAAALFSIGLLILLVMPVRFVATALVVVDPREQRVTTEQDVLPGIGQDAAALQSLIEIAKSDGFLRPLVERLKIASDEDIAGSEIGFRYRVVNHIARMQDEIDVKGQRIHRFDERFRSGLRTVGRVLFAVFHVRADVCVADVNEGELLFRHVLISKNGINGYFRLLFCTIIALTNRMCVIQKDQL